ncbi:MAG: TetR/AcrR family transcriptional regulator [Pseudorhodoplanes sp.]|jgi:AcrR family transcriptional regulator|nr:TetR/AcrR family transcriptional regulator [Pseudorhodoplanes sp.]
MKSRSSAHLRARANRRTDRAAAKAAAAADETLPRKRSTHRRSPEIIEAAARVFAERGYHGATTQDIADVLNIRQASLYYYFPSKEVALEIVCTRGVEDFYKAAQAIADGPGSAAERLAALIRSHISPILDRGDFVKVFLTQRQFLPNESRRRVGKWSQQIEKIFETVIRAGIRSGEFRSDVDPRLTTLALLGMANGVAGWYAKENTSIERIGGEFVALTLQGLIKKTRSGPRRR